MDIYEAPARSLLRKLHARDRSKWTLAQVEQAINKLPSQFPKAQLPGDKGTLLNDIKAAVSLGDAVRVLEGKPPKPVRQKGPRLAATVPYQAGAFLRGRAWNNKLTEQDWLDFAASVGYDTSRIHQARAAMTAAYHAIRGWLDSEKG